MGDVPSSSDVSAEETRVNSAARTEPHPFLETGRVLFAREVSFMLSGVSLENLPPPGPPEICFAGRSNVGKSSLINALTNRNGLARASNTPGRTRELNYFNIDDRIWAVDLPGYGYARASKVDIAKWTALTRAFLRGRAQLRRVFILIDSRHGIKPTDLELMDMLDEAAVTYQLIFTKTDKIKPPEVIKGIMKAAKVIKKRPAAFPEIIPTSSVKKDGLDLLKAEIASLALPDKKTQD